MIPSVNFYNLLVQFEGLKLKAYLDSASIPTIGIGTIRYPQGNKVLITDTCSESDANIWAKYEADKMALKLSELLIGGTYQQNEFDALMLLMYNIGSKALADSTVLKRIKTSTGDIDAAWMMWNKARVNGKLTEIAGLTNRRKKELQLFNQKNQI